MDLTKEQIRTDILKRVQRWAGTDDAALTWYRTERIPSLGGRTPEELVNQGLDWYMSLDVGSHINASDGRWVRVTGAFRTADDRDGAV